MNALTTAFGNRLQSRPRLRGYTGREPYKAGMMSDEFRRDEGEEISEVNDKDKAGMMSEEYRPTDAMMGAARFTAASAVLYGVVVGLGVLALSVMHLASV